MKSFRKNVVGIGITLILLGGNLLAQPAPAPAPDKPDAVIGGEMTVTLTLAEMNAKLGELTKQSDDDVKIVVRLRVVAHKEKDIIKLNCINDKLLQIKALKNIMDAAKFEFDAQIAKDDAERSHQFTRITISGNNIRQLREEAQACAGEITFYTDAKSGWEGPDIPDDPSQDLFPTGVEEPGYASPFD